MFKVLITMVLTSFSHQRQCTYEFCYLRVHDTEIANHLDKLRWGKISNGARPEQSDFRLLHLAMFFIAGHITGSATCA